MPLGNSIGLFLVQVSGKSKMPDTKSGIKHLSNLAQMHHNICLSLQGFYKKQFKSNMKVSVAYSVVAGTERGTVISCVVSSPILTTNYSRNREGAMVCR